MDDWHYLTSVSTDFVITVELQYQDSEILVKEQTSITKEHNRKPEVEPHSQLTVDYIEWRQHNGTEIVFSTNGVRTTGRPYAQKKKDTDSFLHRSYTLHKK